jgi:hypothetical protein
MNSNQVSILNQLINLSHSQAPQVDTVYQQLSGIDERKSEGFDNIPNKLLKIAATVIAPSLTGIFAVSIDLFPFKCFFLSRQVWTKISSQLERASQN